MRNRTLIIVSCICMLGMTVVQAYALPCCCKIPSQVACTKHPSSGHMKDPRKECEHKTHWKATAKLTGHIGHEKTSFPSLFHKCRCSHPSQAAIISAQKVYDNGVRPVSATLVVHSHISYSQPDLRAEVHQDPACRGIAIHIATCALRC